MPESLTGAAVHMDIDAMDMHSPLRPVCYTQLGVKGFYWRAARSRRTPVARKGALERRRRGREPSPANRTSGLPPGNERSTMRQRTVTAWLASRQPSL